MREAGRTLKDATTEAIRDWVTNVTDSHYIIGSVVGPAPYPRMVRDFQAVIGREARAQMLAQVGRLEHRDLGVEQGHVDMRAFASAVAFAQRQQMRGQNALR